MNAPILVLGGDGQLGRAWAALLGQQAIVLTRREADLSVPGFARALESYAPSAVVNAVAYTQVDTAEGDGRQEAMRVNAEAVGELAAWCRERGVPLVHYSTDYVFGSGGNAPHHEDEDPAPLNAYGASKLAGELAIKRSGVRYLMFRTCWVYDAHGKNFFTTMLRLFKEKEVLSVVSDQIGAPTYAPHLARASAEALTHALALPSFPSGTYHLCGSGETSWHGFAQAILTLARSHDSGIRCQRIDPIPSTGYPTPATRPLNSRLDCTKAHQVFGVGMPHWEAGLRECIEEKYGYTRREHSRPEDRPARRI